jgi:MoaA/NifB/PqqE/SkfB family radical SAM enzyme
MVEGEYIMEKLKQYYEDIQSCVENNTYKILSVQINLLNKCYQHCIGCRKYEWPAIKIDFSALLKVIDELSNMSCQSIVLSGGEPLMYDNIDSIVEYIHNKGMKVGILTSGMFPSLINKRNNYNDDVCELSDLEKVIKYSDYIAISFDGSTLETFEKCRGINARDIVIDNINIMQEMKNYLDSKVRFKINMTVSNLNYQDMSGVLRIAQKNNMNECNFFPIHTWNDLKLNNISKVTIINCVNDTMLAETEGEVKTNIQSFLSTINRNKPHICIMPFIHFIIDSDGSVFSCCRLLDDNGDYNNRNKNIILGNIYKMNIRQILDNGSEIRKKLYYANEKVCWSCDRYNKLNEEYFKWMIDDNSKVFL